MKTSNLSVTGILSLLSVLISPVAGAETKDLSSPPHWTNDDQKIVYYLPRPKLTVTVSNIAADDEYWDQLEIDLSYDNAAFEDQVAALQAAFPGYQVNRPILEKNGDFELSVPSLGVKQTVQVMPNAVGPYFHWSQYVPKAKSAEVRSALGSNPDAVRVTGNVGANVPAVTTLEQAELPESVCSELLGDEPTVRNLLANLPVLQKQIDALNLKNVATRNSLQQSALTGCFNLQKGKTITSFKALLDLKLRTRTPPFKPKGESTGITSGLQSAPLYYDLVKDIR